MRQIKKGAKWHPFLFSFCLTGKLMHRLLNASQVKRSIKQLELLQRLLLAYGHVLQLVHQQELS